MDSKLRRAPLARLPLIFDAGIYCWNRETAAVLQGLGAKRLTFPWELNSRQLEAVAGGGRVLGIPTELIVYGRIPMMVSAQCIRKTTGGCRRRNGLMELRDRTGVRMPVRTAAISAIIPFTTAPPYPFWGMRSWLWDWLPRW